MHSPAAPFSPSSFEGELPSHSSKIRRGVRRLIPGLGMRTPSWPSHRSHFLLIFLFPGQWVNLFWPNFLHDGSRVRSL